MAQNYANLTATETWRDLVATYPAMANAASLVQNSGPGALLVQFTSSGSAPSASNVDGSLLDTIYNSVADGTAAHIWVRALNGACTVRCGLKD
jgi:hypothetical protein